MKKKKKQMLKRVINSRVQHGTMRKKMKEMQEGLRS